jgi:hypothetical protein
MRIIIEWKNMHKTYTLGKTPLTKTPQEQSLTSTEQSSMAGPNCQAGRGKDGAAPSLGEQWLL